MEHITISELQRNLHKLDDFDIIEVIDKKRDKVKGYFIEGKYAALVKEIVARVDENKKKVKSTAGSLHDFAEPDLIGKEKGAWKKHIVEKHSI